MKSSDPVGHPHPFGGGRGHCLTYPKVGGPVVDWMLKQDRRADVADRGLKSAVLEVIST